MHHGRVAEYEYVPLPLPAGASRNHVREVMTLHAQYGGWELHTHQIWPDGRRRVTLRRRVVGPAQPPLST